jgi:hypothetical protein
MTNSRIKLLQTPLGLLVILFCFSILSGCTIPLNYTPGAYEQPVAAQPVELVVTDKRPYVVNGKETIAFIGHVRGGYGNPWAYTTQGKVPLTKQMEGDLTKELAALGFAAGAPGATRKLNVDINDFNFDGYKGGKFWYELNVTVSDASNAVLAEQTIKEKHLIRSHFGKGALYGILEQVPVLYNELIRKMVRENPKILQTLKQSGK